MFKDKIQPLIEAPTQIKVLTVLIGGVAILAIVALILAAGAYRAH